MKMELKEVKKIVPNGKTIVIDLDGTLCGQTSGGDEYRWAMPKRAMIDKLWDYYEAGWQIIIHTARGMKSCDGDADFAENRYGEMTETWLWENEVPFSKLIFGKPAGDMYVDDKGVSIEGFLREEVR